MSKQALRFTSLNQIARLALGPIILALLPFFLSVEQQGFWFAMTSITAFMAFADMGLSTAIMQCAAHEYAKLQHTEKYSPENAVQIRLRLDSLLIYSIRRVGAIASLALPCILIIGFLMLDSQGHSIHWRAPWVVFCLTSTLSLILTVVLSYHEGCDAVAQIQRLRALVATVNLVMMALGLIMGLGLWALSLATGISTAVGFSLIWKLRPPGFLTLRSISAGHVKVWSQEVSPLLSKYAASWIGGYLMFHLFTPIVFRLEGAAAAGKVGLTISIFTAIFTLSNIWSVYQLPKFSMAIALRDRYALDSCLSTALKGAIITYALMSAIAIVAFLALRWHPIVAARLLDIEAFVTLTLVWLLQLVVHNLAVYLRAFKEEPIVWHTLLAAVHTIVATVVCLHYFNISHLFLGFLTVYIWFAPAVFVVFSRKRKTTLKW